MPAEDVAHLSLELVRGREPIQGRLSSRGGAAVEFTGWLELAQVIAQVMGDHSEEDADAAR